MESKTEIIKAIVSVMKQVRGMEKNSRVGTGNAAYDGTRDRDVKEAFNEALANNGLCILPTSIEETTDIQRWEEETNWGVKQKQSVFTKVKTKYLLFHESGESIELAGYGHGVDPQDKGAGKALTYALKNTLLYSFLTPVGKIEDTDTTHSNDIQSPAAKTKPASKIEAPELKLAKRIAEDPKAKWFQIAPFKKGEFKDMDLAEVVTHGATAKKALKVMLDYIDAHVLDYPLAKERLEDAILECDNTPEQKEGK